MRDRLAMYVIKLLHLDIQIQKEASEAVKGATPTVDYAISKMSEYEARIQRLEFAELQREGD